MSSLSRPAPLGGERSGGVPEMPGGMVFFRWNGRTGAGDRSSRDGHGFPSALSVRDVPGRLCKKTPQAGGRNPFERGIL